MLMQAETSPLLALLVSAKLHLAEAYGRECCKQGMKAYFLKASELNDKFTIARKYSREAHAVQSLVKPTCLIIDEVGRYRFN